MNETINVTKEVKFNLKIKGRDVLCKLLKEMEE